MADQSSIQSLIQQLAGTHTSGQQNLPSSVNNGNPNTIYNVQLPQGGYLPPVSNNLDQWRINPLPTQPGLDWQQLAGGGGGGGSWGGPVGPPGGPVTFPNLPPPTGTPTPPGGTAPPPVNTGGGLPPTHTGPIRDGGGEGQRGGHERGIDWLDFGGDRTLSNTLESSMKGSFGSTQPTDGGTKFSLSSLNFGVPQDGNVTSNGTSFLGQMLDKLQQQAGVNPDGTISAAQIMDYIIPGNAYLSGSQKWDVSNVVASLLQSFSGLPVNAIMTSAGKYLANPNNMKWLPAWIRNIFVDHYKDNAQNIIDKRNGGPDRGQDPNAGHGEMLGNREFGHGWLDAYSGIDRSGDSDHYGSVGPLTDIGLPTAPAKNFIHGSGGSDPNAN